MKRLMYPCLLLIGFSACKKDNKSQFSITGNGNIIQNQSLVSNSGFNAKFEPFNGPDSTILFSLMSSNKLSIDGYVFFFYESDNALGQDNLPHLNQHFLAGQERNGLPVFEAMVEFNFVDGVLNGPPPPWSQTVGQINLDTKSNLSLQTLRNLFIKADNAREAYPIGIPDSTLVAQFGYYNVSQTGTPNYTKAWFVHPHHWGWPLGYFRDDNGATILLDPVTHSGPVSP